MPRTASDQPPSKTAGQRGQPNQSETTRAENGCDINATSVDHRRRLNSTCPLLKLPTELISSVISFAVLSSTARIPQFAMPPSEAVLVAHRVAAVCHKLRTIAVEACPEIWAYLVDFSSFDTTSRYRAGLAAEQERFIQRAKNFPLDLEYRNFAFNKAVVEEEFKCRARIRRYAIGVERTDLAQVVIEKLGESILPVLERLTLWVEKIPQSAFHFGGSLFEPSQMTLEPQFIPPSLSAPKLRELSLEGWSINQQQFADFRNLAAVSVSSIYPGAPVVENWLILLKASASSLRSVRLEDAIKTSDAAPSSLAWTCPIDLPVLQILEIRSAQHAAYALLHHMKFSSSCRVDVDCSMSRANAELDELLGGVMTSALRGETSIAIRITRSSMELRTSLTHSSRLVLRLDGNENLNTATAVEQAMSDLLQVLSTGMADCFTNMTKLSLRFASEMVLEEGCQACRTGLNATAQVPPCTCTTEERKKRKALRHLFSTFDNVKILEVDICGLLDVGRVLERVLLGNSPSDTPLALPFPSLQNLNIVNLRDNYTLSAFNIRLLSEPNLNQNLSNPSEATTAQLFSLVRRRRDSPSSSLKVINISGVVISSGFREEMRELGVDVEEGHQGANRIPKGTPFGLRLT